MNRYFRTDRGLQGNFGREYYRRHRVPGGFTFVELLVTIAVLSIVLTIAIPSFTSFIADSRTSAARNKLTSSISLARSEAIKTGAQAVICRRNANANTCAGNSTSGTAAWSNGWLVYADADEDTVLDAGELVRVVEDLPEQTTITFAGGDLLRFDNLGALVRTGTGEQIFAVSDSADSSKGQALSILPTGRVRTCVDWNVVGQTCDDS